MLFNVNVKNTQINTIYSLFLNVIFLSQYLKKVEENSRKVKNLRIYDNYILFNIKQ